MVKPKLSMSEKIRRQLEQGKSVKEISKYLKCSPGLIYAVRSADKKKAEKPKAWKMASVSTGKESLLKQRQNDILDTLAMKPGAIRYGDSVLIPKDYAKATPKRSMFKRIINWFCGA